jgi:hypothetical protein
MHKAIEDGDHASLSTVFASMRPNPESEPPDGIRALARAAQRGDTEAIAVLLLHANPNARDRDGATPLMWACKMGHDKAAFMLLDGSDPNALDAKGRSAADHARGSRPRPWSQTIQDWQNAGREQGAIAAALVNPPDSEPCGVEPAPRTTRQRL